MSTPPTSSAEPGTTPAGLDPQVVRSATAIIVGAITVLLDTTIVSIAIHQLGTDLGAGVDTIQWVSTAYLLAMFVAIPVTGWAQERLGGKRLWLSALTLFIVGSLLCAVAWDPASLIAFRVVQGLGGGIMIPLMMTLIMQAARGQNIGRLIATVSLPATLAPILGPVIGGLILHWLDWRWLFLVNLPIGIIGFLAAARVLPADGPTRRPRLDVVGMLLLSPGVVGLVWGLSNVADGGVDQRAVIAPVIAGLVLVAAFALHAVRRGAAALVDVRLFRHRALTSTSLLMFLGGAALYGAMLLLPLYYQVERGQDALSAGLLLIPQGVGSLLSRGLAGRLIDTIGTRVVGLVGFAVVAEATAPFAFAGAHTSYWLLGAALLVRGAGLGAVMIPLMSAAYVGLDHDEVPHASIINRVAQQLGGSFGVAVLAVILHRSGAFDQAFWWATGFTAIAVVLSLILPGRPARTAPTR